jgi:uncharacterized protein (DUF488 family)
MRIFTIGHSTRPLEEFIGMLQGHAIERLADIRTMPRSRHNPQFNTDTLPAALAPAGIAYIHLPGLGGLRPKRAHSINTGWRNASFRAYADYMQTEEFNGHIERLIAMAENERIALMCAEAVPWRCHRSLVGDALLVRNIDVEEIVSAEKLAPHTLTPFARVEGTRITYPSAEPATGQLF